MLLTSGTRLGPYEILAPLGAGGMGEVYRARDTKLGREVAVKVLPEHLASDPEALSRFEREARAVASLSHPNILEIHDFGQQDGVAYAVMELLEGETLRERLLAGALPVRKAVEQALQVAQGLAAAHDKGVVHRDLKPENLFLTVDGRIKILDFGLAKPTLLPSSNDTKSPTLARHTEPGQVMGTVGYMSPEQVKGLPADHRSDIFSFGVVLYEMLSGRRAFQKDTAAETMTAILKEDPPEPRPERDIPETLSRILWHCLEKDANARVQSARDLVFDLQLAAGLSSGRTAADRGHAHDQRASRQRWTFGAVWALSGALAALSVLAVAGRLGIERPGPIAQVSANLPATDRLWIRQTIALSPDSQTVAYVAIRDGAPQLFLRALNEAEGRPIPGAEGATGPFFSPDGKWIGFGGRDGKLKAVPIGGGAARVIGDAEWLSGASWWEDGTIVYTPLWNRGLLRVPAEGGPPQPLTTLDAKTEGGHVWPQILPGGKAVLFTNEVQGKGFDDARIEVLDLATGRRRVVIEGGTHALYVATGHLVYARASTLMAAPFDLRRLAVASPGVVVLDGVGMDAPTGRASFAVSPSGTLAYVPGREGIAGRTLQWLDREGRLTPASEVRRSYESVRLSPDGHRIAAHIIASSDDIWTSDPAAGTLTRLTFGSENENPIWTPDGQRLIFDSDRAGAYNLHWMAADGSGRTERLASSPQSQLAEAVSPDGRTLTFAQLAPAGDWDLWMLPLSGTREPRELVASTFNEWASALSPDGRWIAYHSDESGQYEVYLQPFPGPGGKRRVSADGGESPRWSRDGKELLFRRRRTDGFTVMSARVSLVSGLAVGRPAALTEMPPAVAWDVGLDGRFLIVRQGDEETSSREIRLIFNWTKELKRRVPR